MKERDELNPFRSLLEVWCLQEMIWHHNELGFVLRQTMNIHSFQDQSNAWVFRALAASKGDFKRFIRILIHECPDRLRAIFWARLAVIKKTVKLDSRDDWTPELDIDEVWAVLQRDDDDELIEFCHSAGLTDVGKREADADGHPEGVHGVRERGD